MQSILLPIFLTLLSSGVWTFLIEVIKLKTEKKSSETKMLLGLGYDVLFHRLTYYIDRGWISTEELQACDAVYRGYLAIGGNGLIRSLYETKISKLPNKAPTNGDK